MFRNFSPCIVKLSSRMGHYCLVTLVWGHTCTCTFILLRILLTFGFSMHLIPDPPDLHACMQQQQQAPALDPCLLLSQQTDATPAVTILLLWQSVFVFLCLPCCCWRFRPQSAIYLRKALCVTCKYMYV